MWTNNFLVFFLTVNVMAKVLIVYYDPWPVYYFSALRPESGNFVSRSGREVGAFRPEGRKFIL